MKRILFFVFLLLASTSVFAQRNLIYTFDGLQLSVPSTYTVSRTQDGGLNIQDAYGDYEMETSAVLASTLNSLVNSLIDDLGSSYRLNTDDYFSYLPGLLFEVGKDAPGYSSFSLIEKRSSQKWALLDYSCYNRKKYSYVKGRIYTVRYGAYVVMFSMEYPYDASVNTLQRIANSLKYDSSAY